MSELDDIRAAFAQRDQAQPTNDESLLQRSGRRAGQEVLSTPGVFQGIRGLVGAAYDRVVNDDDWGSAMLDDGFKELIDRAQAGDELAAVQIAYQQRDNPEAALRPGLRQAAEWYDWAGDVVGVTDNPDGSVPLDEEVGGIIGSTLLTLPAALVARPIQAANRIGNTAGRLAATAAIRSAELMTPVTLGAGRYGGNIAANAAVQIAMNDAIRYISDEQTLTGSIVGSEPLDENYETGMPLSSGTEQAATLAGAAAVAAGAIAGGRRLSNAISGILPDNPGINRGTQTFPNDADRIVDDMQPRDTSILQNVGDRVRSVNEFVLDGSSRLTRAVETVRGADVASDFADLMAANTGAASRARINTYVNTGVLDQQGSIRTVAPRSVLQGYASMPRRTQERVSATINALAERERRSRNAGVMDRNVHTDDLLQRTIDDNMNNPTVRRVVDDFKNIMEGFTELRYREGIIDRAQYLRERARSYYAPAIPEAQARRGLFANLLDPTGQRNRIGISRFEQQQKGGNIKELADPMSLLGRYISEQMTEVGNMKVRRAFLDSIANRAQRDYSKDRRVIVSRKQEPNALPIKVRENGQDVTYYVGDRRIHRALEFNPAAAIPIATDMRRLFQMGTTGDLNPMFAPVSLAYDAFFGMLSGDARRAYTGLIDQRLARMGMSARMRNLLGGFTRPIDTLLLVGEGLATGFTGRLKQEYALFMKNHSRLLGYNITDDAANRAADMFVKSRYGLMHMSGYSANSLTDDLIEVDNNLAVRWNRATDNLPVRMYRGTLDTIRDAYRMGLFSRNFAHEKWRHAESVRRNAERIGVTPRPGQLDLPPSAVDKIVRHVREVAVDPTKRGASDWVNAMTSATPYGNIMLQSTAHLARMIATNPGARATAITLTGMAAYHKMTLSEEARQYIEDRVPQYKQIGHLAIELRPDGEPFNPDEHLFHFPLGPEMGTIVNVGSELLIGALEGEARESMEPTTMQQLGTALADILSLPVPPIINATLASAGLGELQPGAALDNREALRQPNTTGPVDEMRGVGQGGGYFTDRVAGMITATLGTLGRTISEAAEVLDQEMSMEDGKLLEGLDRAFDVVRFNQVDRQQVGTLFTDEVLARPRGTPMSEQAYAVDNALESMVRVAREQIPSLRSGIYDADNMFQFALSAMQERVSNPALASQVQLVRTHFNAVHNDAMTNISQLNQAYFNTNSNTEVPLSVKNAELNRINELRHREFEIVLQSFGDFEASMRNMFGPDWTLQGMIDAVENDLRTSE